MRALTVMTVLTAPTVMRVMTVTRAMTVMLALKVNLAVLMTVKIPMRVQKVEGIDVGTKEGTKEATKEDIEEGRKEGKSVSYIMTHHFEFFCNETWLSNYVHYISTINIRKYRNTLVYMLCRSSWRQEGPKG